MRQRETETMEMPSTAEYGSELYKANASERTLLRTETRRRDHGPDAPAEYRYDKPRTYELTHHTAGYEPAGSCGRFQGYEVYRVRFLLDGAYHGQGFLALDEAERYMGARGDLV